MGSSLDDLKAWIGRSETMRDQVGATPVNALDATLDHAAAPVEAGAPLPPLWHWLYFLPLHRQSEIGPDGHARRGGFLPPVPLPRRMWAGSQLQFHQPLRVGDAVRRDSRIADVQVKRGRSGTLVFVKLQHQISGPQGLAITEFHDIVYRAAPAHGSASSPTSPPTSAPPDPAWLREIVPDETLLFRYSALTFNGHRIHYDHPYVTQVEGYAGLVVHGPLIATLLLEQLRDRLAAERPGTSILGFEFRAVQPTVHTERFAVCAEPLADGREVRLWARKPDGSLTMDATATVG